MLTVVGLYGVLSFLVAQRRQEIGTRMALGASRENVIGLFLTQGMTLTAVGLGLGLMAALVLTRGLSTLLYGVGPTIPRASPASRSCCSLSVLPQVICRRGARREPTRWQRCDPNDRALP